MRKLSKAQEMVLRQVAKGQVKLVYVGDNAHSLRMWDAIGKGGRKHNRQYDALYALGLIRTPMTDWPVLGMERPTELTTLGNEKIAEMGPAGTLVISDFVPGSGDSWTIRFEKGEDQPYVLYLNNVVYGRYSTQESIYTVYRTHCPYIADTEAFLSR